MMLKKIILTFTCHLIVMAVIVGVMAGEPGSGAEAGDPSSSDVETGSMKGTVTPLEMYKKLFNQHRAIQLDAVKSIQAFGNYEQRYKLVEKMVKQLFQSLAEAKLNLTEWGYLPGDTFPTNITLQEALSKVLENTAMFGDLVLRLPDIVHRLYDREKDWQIVMAWSVWVCTEAKVFEGGSSKLLHLMSQEINLIPKEEDFINPFAEDHMKQVAAEAELDKAKKSSKKASAKKQKRKGPRLSGMRHTEL